MSAVQAKATPEDTRGRIAETAEALFRRIGFAKTTVADIAAELGMSPANVYRFFPSKDAIVEAICRRFLRELEDESWTIARSRGSAASRLERLVLGILAYNKRNLLSEQRVHDVVLAAIENSWSTIAAHKESERAVAEFIIRDGVEAGEFAVDDPAESARLFLRSMVAFIHPVLIAHCIADEPDAEAAARAQIRFLLRAIQKKG
jgi:AcrR family transcriptional regulator